jgi:hypothetical protein
MFEKFQIFRAVEFSLRKWGPVSTTEGTEE